MQQINNEKVKKLGKSFNIVDSPLIVFDLCDKAYKRSREKQRKTTPSVKIKPQMTKKLLQQRKKQLRRKAHHQSQDINNNDQLYKSPLKEPNAKDNQNNNSYDKLDQRKFYSSVKKRLKSLLNIIEQQKDTMLSQVMLIKQDILSSFFSQIIQKINTQCKQKGHLLQFVWNSMFSILQLTMKQLVNEKHHNQKRYLNQHISNHENYQSMLQYDKERISQLKDQLQKTQALNNTLIFNSRCKRRELRKAYIKLKISTNKLNQYKENYLDLQKDYIDLMIETKDVSKQMAEYLFKRRQEILNDKKKTFKLKFSKKANFIKAKQELQNENPQQKKKIKQQLKSAFNKQYEKQLSLQQHQQNGQDKKINKLENFLFEDAMDEFAYYQNTDIIDDDFMAAKTKTLFVDAQTDMIGFELDVEQKYCQVEYIDKIVYGMLRNAGEQTVKIQQKVKKILLIDGFVQVDVTEIDSHKLHLHHRVFDMSFLFQKKANLNTSLYSKRYDNNININNNNSYSYWPSNFNRDQSINKTQGRLSIRISSKSKLKSKNRLSQTSQVSSISKTSIDSQPNIPTVQSVDKNNHKQRNSDFIENSSKFGLKKSNKSKKMLNFIEQSKNNQDQSQSQSQFDLQSKRINSQSHLKKSLTKINNNSLENKNTSTPNQDEHTQRKQLKRQVMIKNQNQKSPLLNKSRFKETNSNQIQQKTKIIQIIAKSCKKIELPDTQDILNQLKQQNPDLDLIDQSEIKDIIKLRQSQENQQNFRTFYQSLKTMIDDLFKHIEITRRYNKSLIPSKQKNLLKTISSVYLQTYRLLQKEEQIYSLMNPLLTYFEVGFGALKKSQLYMKMISFLSHVYLYKQSSHIFNSFIFFTAIDKYNPLSLRVTHQDFIIYLKLLKSLSINFDSQHGSKNFNVQNLFTSNKMIQKFTIQIFQQENINKAVAQRVINKVYQKIQSTTGIDLRPKIPYQQDGNKLTTNLRKKTLIGQSYSPNLSRSQSKWMSNMNPSVDEQEQIKLDVFFCTQLIMQEFVQMKKSLQDSYMPLINLVYEQQSQGRNISVDHALIRFIISCQFQQKQTQVKYFQALQNLFKINKVYDQYKQKVSPHSKSIKTQGSYKKTKFNNVLNRKHSEKYQQQTLSLSEMCSFFMKLNIIDLNRTYYNALSVFRMRQQNAYNLCLKRINEIKVYFQKHHFQIEYILLNEITKDLQLDAFSLLSKSNSFFNGSRSKTYDFSKEKLFSSTFQNQNQSKNGMSLKQVHNKKLLILCFFKFIEVRVNECYQDILGRDLELFYNFVPTLKINLL